MIFLENVYLAKYTTFKIGGKARYFCVVKSEEELMEALNFAREKKVKIFVLGGGSNIFRFGYQNGDGRNLL
jgi:UDP-N-acetylmuramate dehydrogenase